MSAINRMVVDVDGLADFLRTCQYLSFKQVEIAAHGCSQWCVSQIDNLGGLVVIKFFGH